MGGFLIPNTTISGGVANPGIPFHDSPTGGFYETPMGGLGVALSGGKYFELEKTGFIFGYKPAGAFAFSAVAGSPFATSVYGGTIAITPDNRFIYAPNGQSGQGTSIYGFVVNSDGTLTAIAGVPYATATYINYPIVSPDGKHLYVLRSNGLVQTIWGYSINSATGQLTTLAGFPMDVSGVLQGGAFTSDGANLYFVSSYYNTVSHMTRNAITGALTFIADIGVGASPYSISVSRDNKFVTVVGLFAGASVFSINQNDGSLAAVGTYSIANTSSGGNDAVKYNPKYDFVAVINFTNPNYTLNIYAVAVNGALTEVAGSPVALPSCSQVLWSPDGLKIFVAESASINAFSFDPTTGLTAAIGNTAIAGESMAITSDSQLLFSAIPAGAVASVQLVASLTYNLLEGVFDPAGQLNGRVYMNGTLILDNQVILSQNSADLRYTQNAAAAITGGTVNGITALGVNGGYTQTGPALNIFTGQVSGVSADFQNYLNYNTAAIMLDGLTGNYKINGTLLFSATAPTIASGFGTGPSIPYANGTAAFQINVGTGGVASSGVLTLPVATNGWMITVSPAGAPQAGAETLSVVTSTTECTLTNYTLATGVALAWPAGTVLNCTAIAF